ncbi:recombinase family protein [Sanguibacter sp. Z1732]|uniref:recombinase family protein n=1 Tax=Sanguibacter sp. Z1732 TaxID=3435412 RepID=UPI003D9C8011
MRPHVVPDVPPRAVLYLRQSVDREESISLELQETAGRDYATRMGYVVTEVLADPGISGRTWARPAVKQALALVEARDADVIVVWKWSRLARNRRDWAVAVDTIEAAGGRLESSTETVDTTTSTGRLARGMLAEIAAFESDRIGDGWREAHARRVKAGLPANGKPRWGYTYDQGAKVHRPDPVTGPVLAQLYARYVAGESVYSLVRWLNANGHRTSPGYGTSGGVWSDRSLRRVLDSGFGAGLITVAGERHPGVHEPVIDRGLWEAYQVSRAGRRVRRSSERSQYLLSGMVRCACGAGMTGGQFGAGRVAKFRCKAAADQGRHGGGYATMHLVEDEVLAWLRGLGGGRGRCHRPGGSDCGQVAAARPR